MVSVAVLAKPENVIRRPLGARLHQSPCSDTVDLPGPGVNAGI